MHRLGFADRLSAARGLAPFLVAVGLAVSAYLGLVAVSGQHTTFAFIPAAFAVALVYRHYPEVLVMLLILFSTDILQFFSLSNLPSLSLGPGMMLTMGDALLVFMSIMAVHKIVAREQHLLFRNPLLALIAAISLGFVVNVLLDHGGVDLAANRARLYFSYAFYPVVAVHIDSGHRLRRVIGFLMVLGVAALGFQIPETVTGQRLPGTSTGYYALNIRQTILGREVLYTWSRIDWYMLLVAMLPAGLALTTRRLVYLVLASIGLLGILLSFVRGWYNATLAALAVLLLFGIRRRDSTLGRLLIMAPVSILITYAGCTLIGSVSDQFASTLPLGQAILARMQSGTFGAAQASTLLSRVGLSKRLLAEVAQSPLLGIGPLFGGNLDLGVVSTLHALGVLGVLAVTSWIATFYYYAVRLVREGEETLDSYERGVLIALLCAWSGMMVGYAVSLDFFAARPIGIFVIALMAGLLDRLWAAHCRRLLSGQEAPRVLQDAAG